MSTTNEVARDLLDVTPAIIRTIRAEMRRHRAAGLSVPQFRALGFLARQPGASLSEVADFLGLALPTTSKLIDGLVCRALATRETLADDRRRVTLALTAGGRTAWESARQATQAELARHLASLSESDRAAIARALTLLRPLFAEERRAPAAGPAR
ncbi:MAG: MarR family transcriptional regulator [Chloroflexi bacterium]|nr:MarR family transcriptional regulator [Chloroflexota bacterium]